MRILHVGKFYAPERGGIERYTQSIAEWCVRNGDDVAALVHQRPGTWHRSQQCVEGVEVRRAACPLAVVYTPISPSFPFELARALRQFRPQLLHLHMPNPSCFAALASPSARRLPWVVHWHADVPPDSPDWRLRTAYRAYRPLETALLRRAQAIVATSQAYLDASVALQRWRDKATVIALGIDAIARSPSDATTHATLRLLAVGRLSRYKGFDVLLDALARSSDVTLRLVGTGECETELRDQSRRLGIGDRVEFSGGLDDRPLLDAYANTDAFVLPSLDRNEAFGMVLLEAMRAGLPTIATSIAGSGVGEVVADRETGVLVPPGDAAALAAAIETFRDGDLRRRYGDAGRARFEERFTLARSAQAIREAYRRVLQARLD